MSGQYPSSNYPGQLFGKVLCPSAQVQGAELAQLVRWMTLNQEVPSSSLDTAI